MPIITSTSTLFLNMASCTISTGYGREHSGFTSSFNSKSTDFLFHVPRAPSNICSNIPRRDRIPLCSSIYRCWHFLVVTLFMSDFSLFVYTILCILRVELTVIYDSNNSLMYKLIYNYSDLIIYPLNI